jgi:hypothetical protein
LGQDSQLDFQGLSVCSQVFTGSSPEDAKVELSANKKTEVLTSNDLTFFFEIFLLTAVQHGRTVRLWGHKAHQFQPGVYH